MGTPSSIVQDYAARLRQGVREDSLIRDFRERFSHRFQELCMVHLSFLIDIPWNVFEHRSTSIQEFTPKSTLKRLLAGSKVNPQQFKTESIPVNVAVNVITLIEKLDTDEVCATEGIFRKAGHILRKRQLHEAAFQTTFDGDCILWDMYSIHDLATALKSVLVQLPSPLLTDRLMPLFLRVAGVLIFRARVSSTGLKKPEVNPSVLEPNRTESSACLKETFSWVNDDLIESKQLKALRLLMQLLPTPNKRVLRRLLQLLTRVVRLQSRNRMNSSCLGTVFGPVLFPEGMLQDSDSCLKPSRPVAAECHERCKRLASMTTVLVDAGLDIFLLPKSLAEDVHTNSEYLSDQTNSRDPDSSNPFATASLTYSPKPMTTNQSRGFVLQGKTASPCFASPNSCQNVEDSPPLRTGIRFATPTLSSAALCSLSSCSPQPVTPSPSGTLSTDFCRIPNLIQLPTTICCCLSESGHKEPLYSTGCCFSTELSRPHDSFAAASFHLPGSSSALLAPLVSNLQNSTPTVLARRSSFTVLPRREIELVSEQDMPTDELREFDSGFVFALNSIKPAASTNDLEGPIKVKPNKKRRYTELKLPNSIQRPGPRKNIFSPCPPLRFLPFRRVIPDKRVSTTKDLNKCCFIETPNLTSAALC
ncbi:hypothetical protein EG68_01981 [Paragonimus skrjabini miyazakii]|uniref:Rho-GAP domain-containing protein n=1 Tax=Paragonimus skrjabini miyazakii TaxID=59628 RepID=A0A8S9Z182_9TREM|nr:hypothetical protein EG68_01981 [Paragonimus skrjabini miyazakii]